MNSWKDEKRWGGFSAPRAEGGAGTSRAGPVCGERLWEKGGVGARPSRETEQTFRWRAFFCVGGTAREVPAPPSARGAVGRLGRGQFSVTEVNREGRAPARPRALSIAASKLFRIIISEAIVTEVDEISLRKTEMVGECVGRKDSEFSER